MIAALAPGLVHAQEEAEEAAEPAAQGGTEESRGGDDAGGDAGGGAAGGSPYVPNSGYFRVDTDSLGTQFWFGATHKFGGLSIASDIYVVGPLGEFDIGPSFTFGSLSLTPMVGIVFDFATTNIASLAAPQLYTIFNSGKLYFESWVQLFFNSPFTDGAQDVFYTRNFLQYKLNDWLQIGPQFEVSFALNESVDGAGDDGITSLPIGLVLSLNYGPNNTLMLFGGYEMEAADGTDGIAGRFTFVRYWGD